MRVDKVVAEILGPEFAARPEPSLARTLEQMEAALSFGTALLLALERDHFLVTWARALPGGGAWVLRATVPEKLQRRLGLAPEIAIVATVATLFVRTLDLAGQELTSGQLRTDPGLYICVDPMPDLEARIRDFPGSTSRISWTPEDGFRPLGRVLVSQLQTYDAFAESRPVRGEAVLGRREEIASLGIEMGKRSFLGVFGLRKVGKTTLVRAVLDAREWKRDLGSGWLVVFADLQEQALDGVEGLAWSLAEALSRELGVKVTRGEGIAPALVALREALRAAAASEAARVCVVIDEFDLLFEEGEAGRAMPGARELLGLLRGLGQGSDRFSFVLIGRDPSRLNAAEIDGASNHALHLFHPYWVPPMKKRAALEMFQKLGRRMCLDVNDARDAAWRVSGGHPMVLRQFGSELQRLVPVDTQLPVDGQRPCGPWVDEAERQFVHGEFFVQQVEEVRSLLRKSYPGLWSALVDHLEAATPSWAQVRDRQPAAAAALERFGLVAADGFVPWFVRALRPAKSEAA